MSNVATVPPRVNGATCWNSFQFCLILRNATSVSSDGVVGSRLKGIKLALRGSGSVLQPIGAHYWGSGAGTSDFTSTLW